MKHLTVDELIDFVSMSSMDADSMKLASNVNLHIGECNECLRKLRAFQIVYDELCKIGRKTDYRQVVYSLNHNIEEDASFKQMNETKSMEM